QGQISNHAVDPRCRGRGIGTMLFKEIEGKLVAKGASEIEVMVPIDSLNGRKFFEDVGFVDDGRYAFLVKQYQEGRHNPGV
ncbi:MAG: GNAT family N-acetyltransferase, partial [Chloroflexi bacterium]|nr:GNAT family N-acetyltransferase [Chloroflexota bacterium]